MQDINKIVHNSKTQEIPKIESLTVLRRKQSEKKLGLPNYTLDLFQDQKLVPHSKKAQNKLLAKINSHQDLKSERIIQSYSTNLKQTIMNFRLKNKDLDESTSTDYADDQNKNRVSNLNSIPSFDQLRKPELSNQNFNWSKIETMISEKQNLKKSLRIANQELDKVRKRMLTSFKDLAPKKLIKQQEKEIQIRTLDQNLQPQNYYNRPKTTQLTVRNDQSKLKLFQLCKTLCQDEKFNYIKHNKQVLYNFDSTQEKPCLDPSWQRTIKQAPFKQIQQKLKDELRKENLTIEMHTVPNLRNL